MTENKRFEIISVDYTNIDIPVYVVEYGDVCFAVYEDKEDVQKICDLLNELNDGNKELKEGVEELNEICKYYEMRIKELDSENRQIRDTIKEMHNNERTYIGKSVLKQVLEAIQ